MGHKTRSVVSLFAVVTAVLLSPDLQLYLLDTSYSVVAWLDGVDEYNSRQPSYTTGNWVPVHREMDNVEVELEGEVPEDLLGGMYVRIGTNLKCWPPSGKHHAFTGESILHR